MGSNPIFSAKSTGNGLKSAVSGIIFAVIRAKMRKFHFDKGCEKPKKIGADCKRNDSMVSIVVSIFRQGGTGSV